VKNSFKFRHQFRLGDVGHILKETSKRTFNTGFPLASQAAFAFAFSLFPIIYVIVTIIGIIVRDAGLRLKLLQSLGNFLPVETIKPMGEYLARLPQTDFLELRLIGSLLLAVWAASGVIVAWGEAINMAYRVHHRHSFWRQRGTAMIVLLVSGALISIAFIGMVIAPVLGKLIATPFGLGALYSEILRAVGFPLGVTLMAPAYAVVYRYTRATPPPRSARIWPGAFLATWLWVVVTSLFRFYVVHIGTINVAYGSLTVIIFMLSWMYLTSLSVIVGAQFNVVLADHINSKAFTSRV
jgi:membrane protein